MRGAGCCGTAGAVTVGAGGGAGAEIGGGAAAVGACTADGTAATGGGVTGRGGGAATGADGDGGVATGRTGMTDGAVEALTEVAGAAGFAGEGATVVGRLTPANGAMAGFSAGGCTDGGTIGRCGAGAGGVAASFRCVMAFNTSPGREMFERSILVLISSSPRGERDAVLPAEVEPSAEERR